MTNKTEIKTQRNQNNGVLFLYLWLYGATLPI